MSNRYFSDHSYGFIPFLNCLGKGALISIDFDDIRTLMKDSSSITYAIGLGDGEAKGSRAGEMAVRLLGSGEKYKGMLFYVTGGDDLSLYEVNDAAEAIYNICENDADIIFGAKIDNEYRGKIRIDVLGAN